MIGHLWKLVWNRKGANALLTLEILFAFLVLFAVATSALFFAQRYRMGLGFDPEDVWLVTVTRPDERDRASWTADAERFARLEREVERMESVIVASGADNRPYSNSSFRYGWERDGVDYQAEGLSADDDFARAVGLPLVAGRWFEDSDAAMHWDPVVIDRRLARTVFGDADPLGQALSFADDAEGEETGRPERRVVGVVDLYRSGGDFSEPVPWFFERADPARGEGPALRWIVVKTEPGTTAAFEEPLLDRLEAVAPGWSFSITTLPLERERYLRFAAVPLAIGGIVAGFLLLMVVLGMTGVLWQNVTRRTREIGLRRALGAGRNAIRAQIVLEVVLMTGLALALGAIVALQVPALGPFAFVPYAVAVPATVAAALVMVGLAALCALYPGWSATRIRPADALHHE